MTTEKSLGTLYAEALARSRRDTKWNLIQALEGGWTPEQFRHWVETGEQPESAEAPLPAITSNNLSRK